MRIAPCDRHGSGRGSCTSDGYTLTFKWINALVSFLPLELTGSLECPWATQNLTSILTAEMIFQNKRGIVHG